MSRSKQGAPGEAAQRPLPGVARLKRYFGFALRSPWWPVACVLGICAAAEMLVPRSFDRSWLPAVRAVQILRSSWLYCAILLWIYRREVEPRRMLTVNAARGILAGLASLPLLAAAMPVLMAALIFAAKALLSHLQPSASFDDASNALTWPNLLSGSQILALGEPFDGVSSGIIEELLLRGFMLRLFIARGRSPLHAAIAAALVFAFLHGSLVLFPYFFIFGLAMAALAITSGSVWAPIAAHASYNLFVHLAFAHIERGLRVLGLL